MPVLETDIRFGLNISFTKWHCPCRMPFLVFSIISFRRVAGDDPGCGAFYSDGKVSVEAENEICV